MICPKIHFHFCLALSFLCISGLAGPSNQALAQIDGNQSIGSGSWFNDLIWEDEFGNNDHPRGTDNHTNVHISNGSVIQISNGIGSTSINLIIGNFDDGLNGTGRLEVTGTGSLSVGGILSIAGSANSGGSMLIDTTGTVEGNIRVGRLSNTVSVLDMRNGAFTGNLEIGFISAGGIVNFSGGTINAQGVNEGLNIRTNGVLNQTGGQLNVILGDFGLENNGIYNFSGGTANLVRDFNHSGDLVELTNDAQLVVGDTFFSNSNLDIFDTASIQSDHYEILDGIINLDGGSITASGTNGFMNIHSGLFTASAGEINVQEGLFVIGVDNRLTTMSIEGNSVLEAGSLTIGSGALSDVDFFIEDNATVDIDDGTIRMGLAGTNHRFEMNGGTLIGGNFFSGIAANSELTFEAGAIDLDGFIVGVESNSTVSLTGDADFMVFGSTIIGQEAGGVGSITAGSFSDFETEQLQVGLSGQGNAVFTDNAFGIANGATFVGINNDGVGEMTVSGFARFDALDNIFIGRDGQGNLTVSEDSKINGQQLQIGRNANSIGSVQIRDRALADFNGVFLAVDGTGTLSLEGDSVTTSTFLSIAQGAGSEGSLELHDKAQLNLTGNLLVASANVESTATVTINDNAIVNVGGDSFTGNVQGVANFNMNGGQVNVANNANFGGSNSTTTFNMNAGVFVADNVRFDGFSPATTENTLNMNGGTLRSTNNIEFQRGIVANISGGTIESDEQMIFGNDATATSGSVRINQTGGTVHSKVNIDVRGEGETLYTLSGGTLSADQDVLFGNVDTVSAEFTQEGGTMNVSRNLVNLNVVHEVTGGNLNVAGTLTVGDASNDSSASFLQLGGNVDAGFEFIVENTFADFEGGTTRTDIMTLGNLSDEFLFTEVTVSGTAKIVANELRLETASGAESSLTLSDDALIEIDSLIINDDGTASATDFFHQGGELRVNSIQITGAGIYGISDGVLTSREGDMEILGDLLMTRFGEIEFRDEMTIEISKQFVAVDLFGDGNVGKLDFSAYGRLGPGSGYLKLIGVGDNSNLLAGNALDNIVLEGVLEGQHLTEQEFIDAMTNGTFNGASFALVEGTHFGEAGTIGVAFANFASVPEPRATWLLLVSLVLILTSRLRRTNTAAVTLRSRNA